MLGSRTLTTMLTMTFCLFYCIHSIQLTENMHSEKGSTHIDNSHTWDLNTRKETHFYGKRTSTATRLISQASWLLHRPPNVLCLDYTHFILSLQRKREEWITNSQRWLQKLYVKCNAKILTWNRNISLQPFWRIGVPRADDDKRRTERARKFRPWRIILHFAAWQQFVFRLREVREFHIHPGGAVIRLGRRRWQKFFRKNP